MGFLPALTLILIALKLIGVISTGWFFVLLPLLLSVALWLFIFILAALNR